MKRSTVTYMLLRWIVMGLAIGLVLASTPKSPDVKAGNVELVSIGGTVRRDTARDGFHLIVERNATHHPIGLYAPRCVGDVLSISFRPASRQAGWPSGINVDGWLLRRGYAAAPGVVHGADATITFTKDGEAVSCRDVFATENAAGNVWIGWTQVIQ